jgi:hypothetical protein
MPNISRDISDDIKIAISLLENIPKQWDGRPSVLELKDADYNWRQMEWWAFYFEYKCKIALAGVFEIPGDRYYTVTFDSKRSINWDIKAKAIKSDEHIAILNDQQAMNISIKDYGAHGVIIGLCDVEYNDINRSFQEWHTKLKGGLSNYEHQRIARTSTSRYRKTKAELTEILFLVVTPENKSLLGTMRQGRNSNGSPRPPKYMVDLENIDELLINRIKI